MISLFNFSCPFGITSLICYKITILYKPMAKSMRKGKFRPSTALKPLDQFLWNSSLTTVSWSPPTTQNFISIRRCGWYRPIPSLPHCHWKDNFQGSCFPRYCRYISYERWANKSPSDSILSQPHFCQKLRKSVDLRWSMVCIICVVFWDTRYLRKVGPNRS